MGEAQALNVNRQRHTIHVACGYDFIEHLNNITVGCFSGNCQNGIGEFHWANGSSWEGNFKDGTPIGKGKFIYTKDSFYVGEILNGKRNGFGKLCKKLETGLEEVIFWGDFTDDSFKTGCISWNWSLFYTLKEFCHF